MKMIQAEYAFVFLMNNIDILHIYSRIAIELHAIVFSLVCIIYEEINILSILLRW